MGWREELNKFILLPKVILVRAGINDVGLGDELEIEANYQHFLHKISSVCPNSAVIVHSILPVNSTEFGSLSCNNKQIDRANQIIKRLACYYSYRYLDLNRFVYPRRLTQKGDDNR